MTRNGPSGGSPSDVVQKNTLILSDQQVAADALAAGLFDRAGDTIGFIRLAEAQGLGSSAPDRLDRKKVVL
jgi:lipopolysaccharide biosynthesis regulator YciM